MRERITPSWALIRAGARFDHQAVVVTRAHAPHFHHLARELPSGRLVIQPDNRGIGPGIVYPRLHVMELAGNVPLAILPSDHHVSDERAFMAYARAALDVVAVRRDLVVLLGIEPTRPETEYGWIAPAEVPLPVDGEPVFAIRRVWEKPTRPLAQRLFHGGGLWNSFVMIGWASALLDLVAATNPALLAAFAPPRHVIGTSQEARIVERVHRRLPPTTGFSETVLEAGASRLGVMRVKGVEWSDWGHPRRVLASLARAGVRPAWVDHVTLAEAG